MLQPKRQPSRKHNIAQLGILVLKTGLRPKGRGACFWVKEKVIYLDMPLKGILQGIDSVTIYEED